MATARSITVTRRHLLMAVTGLLVLVLALSSMFSYLTVRHAASMRLPFLEELLRTISLEEAGKSHELLRDSLSTMAVRLGQMQGQLMQLDTLGERLAALAGGKLAEAKKDKAPPGRQAVMAGSGGPLTRPANLSEAQMQRALDDLARQIEIRSETLSELENRIFDERIRKHLLPTAAPVAGNVRASGFGFRFDPFTKQPAMHEGIDFIAEVGTPILAAAAGIVRVAEFHSQYGNMVEIDHGNDLVTRYAHAAKLDVKPGELVKRGQKIAVVGTTGRSTGPHLHFEVRIAGVAQNPSRFLDKNQQQFAQR
jgi:murein DD-endopeptidase MepM/ murein hydrolase activator NlpD